MTTITDWVRRAFGLRGSWTWACRQMEAGHHVRVKSDTGCARYRLDNENQRRIQWTFKMVPRGGNQDWEDAKIFLSDFEHTDWEIWA